MKKENNKLSRCDIGFLEELEDIQRQRIKKGIDKPRHEKSKARITKAIKRHQYFGIIKEDIINADLFD